MLKYVSGNETAMIVLHEIYGVNEYIKEICIQYKNEGYDIFCPDLLNRAEGFAYADADEAYRWFTDQVGFDRYAEVGALVCRLKERYQRVIVTGFSVGATIAWRCSENPACDGVICCYGSRIRDYLDVNPKCPVMLVFAAQDSFDVEGVCAQVRQKKNVVAEIQDAAHGFVDPCSQSYSYSHAQVFHCARKLFLSRYALNKEMRAEFAQETFEIEI